MNALTQVTKVLTDEQVAEYEENGFLLVKGFVDLNLITEIRREVGCLHGRIDELKEMPGVNVTPEELDDGEPPLIRQLMGSEKVNEHINQIAFSDKMLGAMKDLLGAEVELFHSKLMMKAAYKGTFTPWHQDWSYWKNGFATPKLMNAFLAIDNSTLENGCIRYVPGSHREYIEHEVNKQAKGFGIGLPGDINAYDAVPLEMEPGDVAFHDALCIHASEKNNSPNSRIMNTFAYTVVNNRKKRS